MHINLIDTCIRNRPIVYASTTPIARSYNHNTNNTSYMLVRHFNVNRYVL